MFGDVIREALVAVKTILITGTTSGLGFVAAKICLERGANVILLNRESKKLTESLEKLKAYSGEIDVDRCWKNRLFKNEATGDRCPDASQSSQV